MEEKKRKNIAIDLSNKTGAYHSLVDKKRTVEIANKDYVNSLENAPIVDAVIFWLNQILDKMNYNAETVKNYQRYWEDLFRKEIIPLFFPSKSPLLVRDLSGKNRNFILKKLEENSSLSLREKRYRLNAVISFSKFLETETSGFFRKFECPENLTLSSTNSLAAPKFLTNLEYRSLRDKLYQINERDGLIIDLIYFTRKPLAKVLSLDLNQLNLEDKVIFFEEGKEKINTKLAADLLKYIEGTREYRKNTKYLFVTSNGKKIFRTRITQVLQQASKSADLGFTASTKMIQKSFEEELRNAVMA